MVLLIAAAVIWFMIQRKQEEERMRVLRENAARDWLIWAAVRKNLNVL